MSYVFRLPRGGLVLVLKDPSASAVENANFRGYVLVPALRTREVQDNSGGFLEIATTDNQTLLSYTIDFIRSFCPSTGPDRSHYRLANPAYLQRH